MAKVCEILGTRYLTDEYAEYLMYLCSRLTMGNQMHEIYLKGISDFVNSCTLPVQLDIAGCAISRPVWDSMRIIMTNNIDKITFVDTEDEMRNEFLSEFVYYVQKPRDVAVPFPHNPSSIQELVGLLGTLDESVLYDMSKYSACPAVTLSVAILKPTDLRITCDYNGLFKYGRKIFHEVLLKETTQFLYVPWRSHDYYEAELVDGYIQVPNLMPFTVSDFVREFPCIPAWVGTKTPTQGASERVKQAVRQVFEDAEEFLSKRYITIGSYFGGV